MSAKRLNILVIGATGSIGRPVVEEAFARGHAVRALVRDTRKGRQLGDKVEICLGDLTETDSLRMAMDGIDAIVFTHIETIEDFHICKIKVTGSSRCYCP